MFKQRYMKDYRLKMEIVLDCEKKMGSGGCCWLLALPFLFLRRRCAGASGVATRTRFR